MASAAQQQSVHNNLATISLIQSVMRQEVANMGVLPPCTASHTHYPMCPTRQNTQHHDAPFAIAAASVPRFPPCYRNLSEWRTLDDRSICFSCSRHISSRCRHLWYSQPSFRDDRWQYSGPRTLRRTVH